MKRGNPLVQPLAVIYRGFRFLFAVLGKFRRLYRDAKERMNDEQIQVLGVQESQLCMIRRETIRRNT